jgi:DNA replication and repair protein RecF
MDANYLRVLQAFTRALAERNALLKSGRSSPAELAAFEQTLAPAAAELVALREGGIRTLGAALSRGYAALSGEGEEATATYEPNFAETSADAFLQRFEASRARDAQFRTTLTGPHRDDIRLRVENTEAKDFASEGQQRSLVLALRLAQSAWFREKSGVRPVLLADDVLGELDSTRRRRFWSAIDPESQVIGTGTHLPSTESDSAVKEAAGGYDGPDREPGTWQVFDVKAGNAEEREAGGQEAGS